MAREDAPRILPAPPPQVYANAFGCMQPVEGNQIWPGPPPAYPAPTGWATPPGMATFSPRCPAPRLPPPPPFPSVRPGAVAPQGGPTTPTGPWVAARMPGPPPTERPLRPPPVDAFRRQAPGGVGRQRSATRLPQRHCGSRSRSRRSRPRSRRQERGRSRSRGGRSRSHRGRARPLRRDPSRRQRRSHHSPRRPRSRPRPSVRVSPRGHGQRRPTSAPLRRTRSGCRPAPPLPPPATPPVRLGQSTAGLAAGPRSPGQSEPPAPAGFYLSCEQGTMVTPTEVLQILQAGSPRLAALPRVAIKPVAQSRRGRSFLVVHSSFEHAAECVAIYRELGAADLRDRDLVLPTHFGPLSVRLAQRVRPLLAHVQQQGSAVAASNTPVPQAVGVPFSDGGGPGQLSTPAVARDSPTPGANSEVYLHSTTPSGTTAPASGPSGEDGPAVPPSTLAERQARVADSASGAEALPGGNVENAGVEEAGVAAVGTAPADTTGAARRRSTRAPAEVGAAPDRVPVVEASAGDRAAALVHALSRRRWELAARQQQRRLAGSSEMLPPAVVFAEGRRPALPRAGPMGWCGWVRGWVRNGM